MFRVDIWQWSLNLPADRFPALRELLSEDERVRAARFARAVHQERFMAARAGVRQILGASTGQNPRDIALRYSPHGKPLLDGGPSFNLSHCGGFAVLAVSRDGAVGIDIEERRPIEDGVARRTFSPAERAELDLLPSDKWLDGFYRCWTRKEAVIKACGLGLSMPLDGFDVSLAPGQPARLVRVDGDTPSAWRIMHFEPWPGWVGALAARTGGPEIQAAWHRHAL